MKYFSKRQTLLLFCPVYENMKFNLVQLLCSKHSFPWASWVPLWFDCGSLNEIIYSQDRREAEGRENQKQTCWNILFKPKWKPHSEESLRNVIIWMKLLGLFWIDTLSEWRIDERRGESNNLPAASPVPMFIFNAPTLLLRDFHLDARPSSHNLPTMRDSEDSEEGKNWTNCHKKPHQQLFWL